ncbi:type II toxin-antitoxin system RelE/ParE family toxin [Thermomonas sp.]|uniref:type II toxin-antitoxin system RelE/ParE family toxin n=1 Tax=Thermomonas sp. TaxID=1971895 RepID=UPI0024881C88|nr:type II toxin-antitoxin system RelE/ParE family toxin [Thermomonas sp.]MDI1254093.1 type II toxin-antitoxin system RelE/ParE family toxin [Thermomonas sp.]
MTTVRVVILQGAEADLRDLRHYLRRSFGAAAWQNSYRAIKRAVECIPTHPQAGKLPDELTALNLVQYGQVLAGMNRIIYEIRGETAYVHIVCDVRRDLQALLLRRLLEGNPQ